MTRLSRRRLLKLGAAGLAASALPSFASAADQAAADELQPAPSPPVVFKYAELGKTSPVASKDIATSPLGVGFECFHPV